MRRFVGVACTSVIVGFVAGLTYFSEWVRANTTVPAEVVPDYVPTGMAEAIYADDNW